MTGAALLTAEANGKAVAARRASPAELEGMASPVPPGEALDVLESWAVVSLDGKDGTPSLHAIGWRRNLGNTWITSALRAFDAGGGAVRTASGKVYALADADGEPMRGMMREHLAYALRAWGYEHVRVASPPREEIVPMDAGGADIARYADLVVPGMSQGDALGAEEFRARLEDGTVLAWWAMEVGDVAGWCAMVPGGRAENPEAWHLYGSWVAPERRGRGLARRMWLHRMALVPPGRPVTVCIRPGKDASLVLAGDFGFRETGRSGVWTDYELDAETVRRISAGWLGAV